MKLMFSVVFILQLTRGEEKTLQCGDWYTYKDEKCFKLYDNKDTKNYDDAKNTCYQNEGSSLVSIQSQEEQEFIFNKMITEHNITNDVWIGAQYKQRNFKWNDNITSNYTNWANDNPRNESGYECVIMGIVEPYHGKWINEPCSKTNVVLCQKSQNWLFSYLQSTVMELRKYVENLTTQLEISKRELREEIKKNAAESSPTGTIAYYSKTSAPSGWLKANGMTVSRTTYANLFSTIGTTFGSGDGSTTFTLPDLRGEFIRGWSDGRDVDSERSFASFQWGSSIPYVVLVNNKFKVSSSTGYHEHRAFAGKTFDGGFQTDISLNQTRNGMTFNGNNNRIDTLYSDLTSVGNITGWSVLQGTRPRNIALLACIKF